MKIETGTLLSIPLWNKRDALAMVLYASKGTKQLMLIGVYRHYLDKYNSLIDLPSGRGAYWEPLLFTYSNALKDEPWECVGRMEQREANRKLCYYWFGDCLYHQNQLVRRLGDLEFLSYISGQSLLFPGGIRHHADCMIAYLEGCSPEEAGFTPQPMKLQEGVMLALPLRNGLFIPGKVLYLSQYPFTHQKALVCFLKDAIKSLEMPNEPFDKSNCLLRYVYASHLTDGRWPKIGQQEITNHEKTLPLSVDRGHLFQGDKYLRPATYEEKLNIPHSSPLDAGMVEAEMHQLFECPPRLKSMPSSVKNEATDEQWIKSAEWVTQLSRAKTWRSAEKAFAFAIEVKYLELDECYEAIAAAEAVAAALGKPEKTLPPEAKAWAEKHRAGITPELVQLAAAALDRVRKYSELSEEIATASEELKPWSNRLASLAKRLKR